MKLVSIASFILVVLAPESILSFRIMRKKAASRPKILCLHGGGQSSDSFRRGAGMPALMEAFPEYEFVFANSSDAPGNEGYNVWIRDPPGGKNNPTTDPEFAANTINYLNQVVETQGPFYGILGYSQGSAFAGFYLSISPPGTFQIAMLFCGYLPETHLGLMNRMEAGSPIGTRTLIFMGEQDGIIWNGQTRAQATKFASHVVVSSRATGHNVPYKSDPTFSQVVAFLRSPNDDLPTIAPGPAPGSAKRATTPMICLLSCLFFVQVWRKH